MLLSFMAGAQGRAVSDRAAVEAVVSRALWMGTGNAAGLAVQPMQEFNALDFSYSIEDGSYTLCQEGKHTGIFRFDTQGALAVGRIQLWGHFNYDNISVKESTFNTVLFDPFDEREIFYVADPNPSGFKRQVYNMEFKAASALSNRLYAGIYVKYTDRIGAKQVDPRSESYKYSLDIRPSVIYSFGKNTLGISAYYSNMFERSVPVLSNASTMQEVYVLRGLGNFVSDMVGSGGLSTLFYRSNNYGGALQYGKGNTLLAEAGFSFSGTHAVESATQPYKLGSTSMLQAWTSLQWMLPSGKFTARVSYRKTDATEYSQLFNLSKGEYEVKATSVTAAYSGINAAAIYDHYIGAPDSYIWKFGGEIGFNGKDDTYYLPETVFSYNNLSVLLQACRRIPLVSSCLRLGIKGGYKLNLDSDYSYSGIHAADPPAAQWYPHDISILGSNYFRGGLETEWTRALRNGTSLCVNAEVSGLLAKKNQGRMLCTVGLGLIF